MSAPDRIFCKEGHDAWNAWGHWYLHSKGGGTEYVRADICDRMQDERVRALVDAAERLADLWDKDATDRIGPATRQLRAALRDLEQGEGAKG